MSASTTGCGRTDWPCHNATPHTSPRGCVHVSASGSDVPDRHDATSGGEH